jgi:NAD dependent epimerase/dehydratase
MTWTEKHVLITGAGGFIGSHLVESLLSLGAEVTAFVHYNSRNDWGMLEKIAGKKNPHLSIVMGDITDSTAVKKSLKDQDVVFHLAALIGIPYSYYAPESYIRTNILGTFNVVQGCIDTQVEKVIHTSTSEVYGTAKYTPIDENHPLRGQSPYSASKIGADKIVESYFDSFGLPVATIRPFNTFGPRQSTRAIIPTIITQALTSPVVKVGSLTPIRDFTYVLDTVQGFLDIATYNSAIGKTINIGSGSAVSIGELCEMITRRINRDIKIFTDKKRIRPEHSEVQQLICNNSLAREILGWTPQYSLQKGLDETIVWMKTSIDSYKSGVYTI